MFVVVEANYSVSVFPVCINDYFDIVENLILLINLKTSRFEKPGGTRCTDKPLLPT